MAKRVKFFSSKEVGDEADRDIEAQINAWLEANPHFDPVSVQYCEMIVIVLYQITPKK